MLEGDSDDAIRDWLVAVLRGDLTGASGEPRVPDVQPLLKVARREGVAALCWHQLRHHQDRLPNGVRQALREAARQAALIELTRQADGVNALGLLKQAGLNPLLLKGVALAQTHYPEPHLRSRCDTDLLFPDRAAADAAWTVLEAAGYYRHAAVSGRFISQEFACHRLDRFGVTHTLDIHWHPNNAVAFRDKLTFEELDQAARSVPALGHTARTVAPVHALLLALMHRTQHERHGQHNRLIWLYDLHLLAAGFSAGEWAEFERLAVTKGLSAIGRDGLLASQRDLQTPLPSATLIALAASAKGDRLQPGARTTPVRGLAQDLMALPDWASRRALLREHLVPDAEYMRSTYRDHPGWPLPALYLWRALQIGVTRLRWGRKGR